MDVVAGLIPSVVVLGFFIALLVTAIRATDRRSRPGADEQQARQAGQDVQAGDARPDAPVPDERAHPEQDPPGR